MAEHSRGFDPGILWIVGMPVLILCLMFLAWIAVALVDPVMPLSPVNFLFFMSLGVLGLTLLLTVWLWRDEIDDRL